MGRLFGTDGIRGKAGTELTADLARGLGSAAVSVLGRHGTAHPVVVVGRDTRSSGRARAHLAELDAALDRLHDGAYGTCARCGEPIAIERLEAQPAAVTCICCAAQHTTRRR